MKTREEYLKLIHSINTNENRFVQFFLSCRFALIWFSLIILSYFSLDRSIAQFIEDNREHNLIDLFKWLTEFGQAGPYLIFLSLLILTSHYIYRNNYWTIRGGFLILSIIIPGLLSDILKIIFGRNRIRLFFEQDLYDFHWFTIQLNGDYASFPSGHTTTIVGIMIAILLLYPRWTIPCFIFSILVSVSRIFCGAHFLSDVLMGMYIGSIVTLLIYLYFEMKGWLSPRTP